MQNQDQNFILLLFILSLIVHSCASPKRHLIKDQLMENTFVLANIVNLKESLNQRSSVFQIRRGLALNRFILHRKGREHVSMRNISNNSESSFFLLSGNELKLNRQVLRRYSILKQNEQGIFAERVVQTKYYSSTDTVEEYLFYNNEYQVSAIKTAYAVHSDSSNTGLCYNFYHQKKLIANYRSRIRSSVDDIFYIKDSKLFGFIDQSKLIVFDGSQVQLLATVEVYPNRSFIADVREFTISGDWVVFAISRSTSSKGILVVDNVTQLRYALLCINYKTGESFLPDYELVD